MRGITIPNLSLAATCMLRSTRICTSIHTTHAYLYKYTHMSMNTCCISSCTVSPLRTLRKVHRVSLSEEVGIHFLQPNTSLFENQTINCFLNRCHSTCGGRTPGQTARGLGMTNLDVLEGVHNSLGEALLLLPSHDATNNTRIHLQLPGGQTIFKEAFI